jgi:ribosome-associated protein
MTTPEVAPPATIPDGFRVVEISREPIELYKILKFEGITESGGHARAAVAAGKVSVNGAIEIQKRKKIVSGDTIEFEGHRIAIVFCPSTVPATEQAEADAKTEPTSPVARKQRKAGSRSESALVVRAKKT